MTSVVTKSIYLVRHAVAEEAGPAWPDDTVRPLTAKGIARMREIVTGLRALEVDLETVLTSPLLRARQTADIVLEGVKPRPRLAVVDALAPGGSAAGVIEALKPYTKSVSLALVGHEPDLGTLAAWLIGARTPLAFKKGGVCRIDFDGDVAEGAGQLLWLATPGMLRAVGD